MSEKERQLSDLACFVHASLATLHVLGVIYNFKRNNYKNAAFHGIVFLYDIASFKNHLMEKNTNAFQNYKTEKMDVG